MDNQQTNRSHKWFHPDVPKAVRNHLLSEKHTATHRFVFGTIIMTAGVCLTKVVAPMIPYHVVHVILDIVGYGLHGVGLIPFAKIIEGGIK